MGLHDLDMSVERMTATRMKARLETGERQLDPSVATPGALQARFAEAVVLQAGETGPDAPQDDLVTCSVHTEVVHSHRGGPVDLVAVRLQADSGGQLWTVDATTPEGHLIAHSRVRLIRGANMPAVASHHQTPTT